MKVSRYELAIYVLLMNVFLLLLDENSCSTNFMSCDSLMSELVQPKSEPITTLLERKRELHEVYGVSSIIIMGGCMDSYVAMDVTKRAKMISVPCSVEATSTATCFPVGV